MITIKRNQRSRSTGTRSEEAAKLLDATIAPHVRLFIALALHTAARAGALLALRWEQIDIDSRRVALGRGTGNKRRATVPINDALMPELLRAVELRTSDQVIEFGGDAVGSVKTGFKAAVRRAGLTRVTPHLLRHTAATWMAQAGVPMGQIAAFLGNTEAMVQKVYAHHHPDFMREAAEALAAKPQPHGRENQSLPSPKKPDKPLKRTGAARQD